ncbi:hypothetical protein [Deinococcus roseus]|uniref:hypothetical protein n=1 Tax=Deinococcus roseus TaxID=392414 RepID=UPI00166992BE|nr:hypothetical protein [Deinococcus roseus]
MIPFYAAPALSPQMPELVVYVKEHTLKKPQSLQLITLDLPDGTRLKYPLGNQNSWQKISENSRCVTSNQSITVTLFPRKESARHSAVGYTVSCEDLKNHLLLSFAQSASGGLTVKQTAKPTEAMKKASLLKRP